MPLSDKLSEAFTYHQAGQLDQAEALYRQILESDPTHAEATHHLGILAYQHGKADEALKLYQEAIRLDPSIVNIYTNLGLILWEQGRYPEAILQYEKALALKPDFANAYNGLGNVFLALNENEKAIGYFQKAVERNPQFTEAYNNWGNALFNLGQITEATRLYQKALTINPGFTQAVNNLGNVYSVTGEIEAAEKAFQQVLAVQPNLVETLNNLGHVQEIQGKFETAVQVFSRAITLMPDKPLWQLRLGSLCPAIPQSMEEIEAARQRMSNTLSHFENMNFHANIAELLSAGAPSPYLAYHGQNDRDLKSRFADLVMQVFPFESLPTPAYFAKHSPKDKPHVGFLVSHKRESIFVRAMADMINALARRGRIHVSIICSALGYSALAPHFSHPNISWVALPDDLRASVSQIQAQELDVLYCFEVGTDTQNYFLPFFQLAPTQCTSVWGFPVTTGLPTMDYFLSADALEPQNASEHYRETLIRLEHWPIYLKRPSRAKPHQTREALGFSETHHLYCCPQSLLKFHPDFDAVLASILKADPQGELLLFCSVYAEQNRRLMQRLSKSIPDAENRVRFLPRQDFETYLNILAVSDVILDTLYFGGGITSFDGFSMGPPIVTWPSDFARSRVTAACYGKLGISEGVVSSTEAYVAQAVKLATDQPYQEDFRARILASVDGLFEDLTAVSALEDFFIRATP